MTQVLKQPTTRWITFATIVRTFGSVAVSTYLPIFFLKVYPSYKDTFAVANALSLAIGGLFASIAGGYLSDKLENKSLMAKSAICMVSCFLAFPLTAACCLVQNNFWLSLSMITLKTIVSAGFSAPAISMMQNTTASSNQGKIISSHVFYVMIISMLSPILFGSVTNYFNVAANPKVYGYVISLFAMLGYLGSLPFWFMAGKSYKQEMENKTSDGI